MTFGTAAGGEIAASNQPVFAVPAGFTVAWVGWFDNVSGGNLLAKHDVADEVFGSDGTYTLTAETFTIAD